MIDNKKILAIIPARGGSKRLPKKNILEFASKPLIAWSIEASLKSKYITKTIVSTDNNEIAGISRNYGAETPFIRPSEFSTDNSSSFEVVKHAIDFLSINQNQPFDYIVLLQPTSPLRTYNDIDSAIEYMFSKEADAIVSVCETEHSPLWCNTLPDDLSMHNFIPKEIKNTPSQLIPKYYRLNGAIYICRTDILLKTKSFFPEKNIYAYIMDTMKSIDIDTMNDFIIGEQIYKMIKK